MVGVIGVKKQGIEIGGDRRRYISTIPIVARRMIDTTVIPLSSFVLHLNHAKTIVSKIGEASTHLFR
jgi:hypothetical protein